MPSKRYFSGLDGLRGIAVLSVILYHLHSDWLPGGFLGVTMFFVLSGYLITDILLTEWEDTGHISIKHFWKRRIGRLIPAFLAMLIAFLAWAKVFQPAILANIKSDVVAALFSMSNWWYIFHKVSYFEQATASSPLKHLWSLAIETQFYVLWPFLVMIGLHFFKKRKGFLYGILALAVVSALLMAIFYHPELDPSRIYYGTDTRAFSLLIGAALAVLWPSRMQREDISRWAKIGLNVVGGVSLLLTMYMMAHFYEFDAFIYRGGMVLFSLLSACLIAVIVHPGSFMGKLLGFRPLRFLGIRSYGIYLWQFPIIMVTTPKVNTQGVNIGVILLQVLLILVISMFSYTFIEAPLRRGQVKWQLPSTKVIGLGTVLLAVLAISGVFFPGTQGVSEVAASEPEKIHVVYDVVENKDEAPVEKQEAIEPPKNMTFIGDSVLVEITKHLQETFPDSLIDGKIGRQMWDAKELIAQFAQSGKLGEVVIIELGTNGAFTDQHMSDLLTAIGTEREVYFINVRVPRSWETRVNEMLAKAVHDNENVHLINWFEASKGHDEYFYPDGIHPNETGTAVC